MFVYESSELYFEDSVNSYVGGDAYNFIINASYATGYFVLALLFVVLGCTLLLIYNFKHSKSESSNEQIEIKNEDESILKEKIIQG